MFVFGIHLFLYTYSCTIITQYIQVAVFYLILSSIDSHQHKVQHEFYVYIASHAIIINNVFI